MDFQIDGVAYKARAMDAFTQMAVLSKLSPLLASGFGEIMPLIKRVRAAGLASIVNLPMEETMSHLAPVAKHLADMKEEDRILIIGSCLNLVDKEIGPGKWAPIWNGAACQSAFKEINEDAFLMLRIVAAVIQGTFARFFPAGLSK